MRYRIEFLRLGHGGEPRIIETAIISAARLQEAIVWASTLLYGPARAGCPEYFRIEEAEEPASEAEAIVAVA